MILLYATVITEWNLLPALCHIILTFYAAEKNVPILNLYLEQYHILIKTLTPWSFVFPSTLNSAINFFSS